MTLNEYQEKAISTAIFQNSDLCKKDEFYGDTYCALQLASEAGEVAGKYAKIIRIGNFEENFSLEIKEKIAYELGDCFWYIANLAKRLGYTLEQIAEMNNKKLKDRTERGVLHGSGDER